MSYRYSFVDNEIYSADDVNKITKRLVSSGIEDSFANGVAYNVSKFNDAGKLLYTSGIVPESCLTMKVTHIGENAILINPGVAFFEDGSVIEIDGGGEELTYKKGVVNYVYLKNDLESANISYPCCETEEPVGDYIMLAVIDESGKIQDKRTYAKGKLPGYQSVAGETMFLNEIVKAEIKENHIAEAQVTFDIGPNNFSYILSISPIGSHDQNETMAIYSIEDGRVFSMVRKGDTEAVFENGSMYLYFDDARKRIQAYPVLSDGKLKMDITVFEPHDKIGDVGDKVSVNVQLIFI